MIMAFIANTAFQIRRSNDRYEDLQHRTGLYGSFSDGTFTAADASAGLLCNIGDGIPAGGNYMTLAADGSDKLYAANPTDVQRLTNGDNTYAVGVKTLGLGIPAGTKDAFLELREGESYAFGPGNFSTLVTTTNKYATVSNGLLVGTSTAPSAGDGWYFELDAEMGIDTFTEANYNAFARYNLVCKHI
jgi:hypothetical protein